MNDPRPRYSIIVPTYNGSCQLPTLLNSLLRQSINPNLFEIIIIDDGSTDATKEVVERFAAQYPLPAIRYLYQENRGPAAARNTGIRHAQGSILFFTDDDCEVPALWMETLLKVLRRYPHLAGVGGWYRPPLQELRTNPFKQFLHLFYLYMYPGGMLDLSEGEFSRLPFPVSLPISNTANLAVQRWIIEQIGYFDERFKVPGSEDLEFCERIVRRGFSLYYLPYPVTHHKQLGFLSLMKLALRRAQGGKIYASVKREMTGYSIPYRPPLEMSREFQQHSRTLAEQARFRLSPLIPFLALPFFCIRFSKWLSVFLPDPDAVR